MPLFVYLNKNFTMTYQEAIELKQNVHGNIILDKNIPYHVIIAPKLENDFKKFYSVFQYNFNLYSDELCISYCSNNDFILRAHITDEGKEILKNLSL